MPENDQILMAVLLPITYTIVDLLKPIPFVPGWLLPSIAAVTGAALGVTWGMATGKQGPDLMVYGAVGFGFGSGATGVNQIKRQGEIRRDEGPENQGGK